MNVCKHESFSNLGRVATVGALAIAVLFGCGKVENEAKEFTNDQKIRGYWLMTESEHANAIERSVEKESIVLAFKDDKVAFSPTDSLKGKAVFATLSDCTRGPRHYRTDGQDLVLDAAGPCAEKRVVIQRLDDQTLKFPDPDNADITRVFSRIDEAKYFELVKASDRTL